MVDIKIIESDNVAALNELCFRGIRADIAYLDPPFGTGRKQIGDAGWYEDSFVSADCAVGQIESVARLCWGLLTLCKRLERYCIQIDRNQQAIEVARNRIGGAT